MALLCTGIAFIAKGPDEVFREPIATKTTYLKKTLEKLRQWLAPKVPTPILKKPDSGLANKVFVSQVADQAEEKLLPDSVREDVAGENSNETLSAEQREAIATLEKPKNFDVNHMQADSDSALKEQNAKQEADQNTRFAALDEQVKQAIEDKDFIRVQELSIYIEAFKKTRAVVSQNFDLNMDKLFKELFTKIENFFKPLSIPQRQQITAFFKLKEKVELYANTTDSAGKQLEKLNNQLDLLEGPFLKNMHSVRELSDMLSIKRKFLVLKVKVLNALDVMNFIQILVLRNEAEAFSESEEINKIKNSIFKEKTKSLLKEFCKHFDLMIFNKMSKLEEEQALTFIALKAQVAQAIKSNDVVRMKELQNELNNLREAVETSANYGPKESKEEDLGKAVVKKNEGVFQKNMQASIEKLLEELFKKQKSLLVRIKHKVKQFKHKVRQFFVRAPKKLQKQVPDFATVKTSILTFLGKQSAYRKQMEDKIVFLQDKDVMNRLDPASKQYVNGAIAEFKKSIEEITTVLDSQDQNLNELYRLLHQVQDSYERLFATVSGISLPLSFARDTYISQFEEFKEVSGLLPKDDKSFQITLLPDGDKSSNKEIATAIRKVLSPEFAMEFVDDQADPVGQQLGQQLVGKIGNEILGIPLGSHTDSNGYVLSEADGQQVKFAFDALVKELKIDLSTFSQRPEKWSYVSNDFLKKVGETWLRNFAENSAKLSAVVKFEKEQILCNAWQVAKIDAKGEGERIMIFRQLITEFLTYPMSESLQFKNLDGKAPQEPFTQIQRISAAHLVGHLPTVQKLPLKVVQVPDGLSDGKAMKLIGDSMNDEQWEKLSEEQSSKMLSVTTEFPHIMQELSALINEKQKNDLS